MLTAMASPVVRIAVAAVQRESDAWRIAWDLTNMSPLPLTLADAWLPHGRFRGEGHVPLSMRVPSGGTSRVELRVLAAEPAGTVVRNAFLILRTSAGRVFARMRIEFPEAEPNPVIEAVTLQPLESEPYGALS
jgi:hypothetical protein